MRMLNEFDVFRNTALHYLCMKYAAFNESSAVVELELRHCLGNVMGPARCITKTNVSALVHPMNGGSNLVGHSSRSHPVL